jgi:hypothetical protein
VILVSAAAATWNATRRTGSSVQPPAGPAPVETGAPAATPAEPEPPPTDPRPRFLAARATLVCGDATGEAVFIAPDRALGSVPCREGEGQVHLSDGRELLARAISGAPPGTSILDLPGAAAPFVPPGEATALPDGGPLLVALEGGGLQVVGEATARGLVALAGHPLLRAEDAAGPLAGPVIDPRGHLVGIAPSTPPDADRPWLAVPVEAFAAPLGREVPPAWRGAEEQAADEDRRALGELWNQLQRSIVLLAAVPGPNGLEVVVARAAAGRPPAEPIRLAIDPLARDCTLAGRVVDWRTGPRVYDGAGVPPRVLARLNRLTAPAGGGALWMGRGFVGVDCDLSVVANDATLAIPGSDPVVPVPFPRGALAEAIARSASQAAAAERVENQEAAQDRAAAAEQEAAREIGWRNAFGEAHGRIAQARQRRQQIQAERDAARGNFQYVLEEQLNGDLEVVKLEEKRALEALDDLDRRASLDAVPRAWRRE